MKKIILIVALVFSSKLGETQVITDTLQWLKFNIEQKSNSFHGKTLKNVFDSLKSLKKSLSDYDPPNFEGIAEPDTIKTNYIKIYLGKKWSGRSRILHDSVLRGTPPYTAINTHIPFIKVFFINKAPFFGKWTETDRTKLGSFHWNRYLANYWGQFIVDKVEVGEY